MTRAAPAVTRTGSPSASSIATKSSGHCTARLRMRSKTSGVTVSTAADVGLVPEALSRTTTRVRVWSVTATCSTAGLATGVIRVAPSWLW